MLAASALVLAACNGDDDVSPTTPTTAAPDPTVVTSTPETTPTTSDVAPTTAATAPPSGPTTAPPTSAPPPSSTETIPLTVPPTTTVPLDDLTAAEREVVEFVLEEFRLFNELRLDPTNDAKYDAALERLVDPSLTSSRELIEEYRQLGQKEVPFPGLTANISPYLDTIMIADDGSTASVDVCWLNSNVLVEVGGNADGTDRVLNDVISAHYRRYTLTPSDDGWLVSSIAGGDVSEGSLTCE